MKPRKWTAPASGKIRKNYFTDHDPVIFLVSILTILGTMQIYDLIVAMTSRRPRIPYGSSHTRIFAALVGSSRFGYACTMA